MYNTIHYCQAQINNGAIFMHVSRTASQYVYHTFTVTPAIYTEGLHLQQYLL